MFDTHASLNEALTTSGTWNGLYTALMASTPPLAVRAHPDENGNQVTGLEFFERTARIRNSPISGTVAIEPDSGAIVLRADGYTGPRWFAALERLTTTAVWSWQPAPDHKPGVLTGVLRIGRHLNAEAIIQRSSHHNDLANAGFALIPADRDACNTAWALAVTVLGTLVTDDPDYQSTVLPAPDPDTLTAPATGPPRAPSPTPSPRSTTTTTSTTPATTIRTGPPTPRAPPSAPCATSATPSTTPTTPPPRLPRLPPASRASARTRAPDEHPRTTRESRRNEPPVPARDLRTRRQGPQPPGRQGDR